MGLTPGFVGLIERGGRGTTSHTLAMLSKIFDMPIDDIFYRESRKSVTESESLQGKVISYIADFTDEEMHIVIDVVKSLHSMKHLRGTRG